MLKLEIPIKQLVDKLAKTRTINKETDVSLNILVKTPTGFAKIDAVIEKEKCPIQRTIFENGTKYDTSPLHLFSNNGEAVLAKDVEYVDTFDGRLNVVSKEIVTEETVFDILIDNPHWYIARDDGIIHHNTFAALTAVKNFLEEHNDAACFYFESEGALTKTDIEEKGIDSKRIFIIPVATVEDFRTQAVRVLDKYIESKKEVRPKMMFVLDSLGMLSTNKEVKDTAEGKDVKDMTRTQLIKGAFRIMTLKLAQAQVPMLVTNHVYAVFDMYSPSEIGGGCLEYGTEIIMADDSLRAINDVKLGELVKTKDGVAEVLNVWNPETLVDGNPECLQIDFEDGTSIICSKAHRFMVAGEWVEARDLVEGVDLRSE